MNAALAAYDAWRFRTGLITHRLPTHVREGFLRGILGEEFAMVTRLTCEEGVTFGAVHEGISK